MIADKDLPMQGLLIENEYLYLRPAAVRALFGCSVSAMTDDFKAKQRLFVRFSKIANCEVVRLSPMHPFYHEGLKPAFPHNIVRVRVKKRMAVAGLPKNYRADDIEWHTHQTQGKPVELRFTLPRSKGEG